MNMSRAMVWAYVGGDPREMVDTVWRRRSLVHTASVSVLLSSAAMEIGGGPEAEAELDEAPGVEAEVMQGRRVEVTFVAGTSY